MHWVESKCQIQNHNVIRGCLYNTIRDTITGCYHNNTLKRTYPIFIQSPVESNRL